MATPAPQLEHLLQAHSGPALLVDARSRRVIAGNRATARAYGYPLAELAGLPIEALWPAAPAELDRTSPEGRKIARHRRSNGGPLEMEVTGPDVKLVVDTEGPVRPVLCDAVQLDIAVVNLIVNARDAMGGTGEISLEVFACDDSTSEAPKFVTGSSPFVCLTVRDNGPGMSEEVSRHALEPFFSTKGENGTGLGLAQVYGFMRQLGGYVTLETAPGRGTAVHLYFPVAPG